MKLREWIRARITMRLMAAREGRTVDELRQDIQEAIDEAWRNPEGREAQQALFPKGKPSPPILTFS